jgi:hypothetical protein
MSIIETLTEGMVHRNMQQEGAALLNKWSQTGLLEGISSDQGKHNMARLLENQARELLRESSSMGAGDVEGFAAVAFPIVRRVFAGLIANELVSVQPMSLPSGLIFFLDFTFDRSRMGNTADASIYGTDKVGAEIIDGVNLVDSATGAGFSGPLRDGATGYAYASPSGSLKANLPAAATVKVKIFALDGAVDAANKKLIQYDPDLLAITDGTKVAVMDVDIALVIGLNDSPADFNNLSPFQLDATEMATAVTNVTSGFAQVRRLTDRVKAADAINTAGSAADSIRFVGTCTGTVQAAGNLNNAYTKEKLTFPIKDLLNPGGSLGSVNTSSNIYSLENNPNIPEIDIKVDSTAITAQTKKLKAKWTPELGQDLNAYHNLDAEVELTSILSEQIALEIDREILADLVNGATAGTFYWSRSPGLFVNRQTGADLHTGGPFTAPDFTGTVSEWYETLIETINDVSAQIHRKTLRGGANFVVCSPEVANVLEFTAGFRANVTADADKGEIGAVKVGSLSRKFDVMVDPYFPRNAILVGRKGSSFLESGYVYAPYVPLQITPTIFGVEDFVPRKGVMTRYGKKMVRPDMYGLVIVRGLLGESGAT